MIDYIISTLSGISVHFGDYIALFTAAVGLCITILILVALHAMTFATDSVRKRVLQSSDDSETKASRASRIDRSLTPIKSYIVPQRNKELKAIRKRLITAGYKGEETVTVYYASKLVLFVSLALTGGLLSYAWPHSTTFEVAFTSTFGGFLGIVIPSYYIDRKIKLRRTEIINGFPDMLDLVVACTEAGLGLSDAIQRVSRETSHMFPVLSSELGMVNSQIRAGVDRVEALHGLADRTGVEEINGFVSMVSQSIRFGTGIAETLRVFAEEFRDRRMQRAEEQAAKVGTMLIFPLILCIFPSFFVITIGPAVISIAGVFEQLH